MTKQTRNVYTVGFIKVHNMIFRNVKNTSNTILKEEWTWSWIKELAGGVFAQDISTMNVTSQDDVESMAVNYLIILLFTETEKKEIQNNKGRHMPNSVRGAELVVSYN